MRKPYLGVKLDVPNSITGEDKMWLPTLRVRLAKGHTISRAPLLAIVDSGAEYCLFRGDLAAGIGIKDITTGKPMAIGNVKKESQDTYYFHKIKLYIEADWQIEVWAGFSPNLSVGGLLGRTGFFDHFKVTFDHSSRPSIVEIDRHPRVN